MRLWLDRFFVEALAGAVGLIFVALLLLTVSLGRLAARIVRRYR